VQEQAPAMASITSSISAAPIYTVVISGLNLSPTSVPQMNTTKPVSKV